MATVVRGSATSSGSPAGTYFPPVDFGVTAAFDVSGGGVLGLDHGVRREVMVEAVKVSVQTRPTKEGRWENVMNGAESPVRTFESLAEARSAGRTRAKRLRCVHIIFDVDGSPIGASNFGGTPIRDGALTCT